MDGINYNNFEFNDVVEETKPKFQTIVIEPRKVSNAQQFPGIVQNNLVNTSKIIQSSKIHVLNTEGQLMNSTLQSNNSTSIYQQIRPLKNTTGINNGHQQTIVPTLDKQRTIYQNVSTMGSNFMVSLLPKDTISNTSQNITASPSKIVIHLNQPMNSGLNVNNLNNSSANYNSSSSQAMRIIIGQPLSISNSNLSYSNITAKPTISTLNFKTRPSFSPTTSKTLTPSTQRLILPAAPATIYTNNILQNAQIVNQKPVRPTIAYLTSCSNQNVIVPPLKTQISSNSKYTSFHDTNLTISHERNNTNQQESNRLINKPTVMIDPLKQKKACNCTKSQCLKLYCECFANGEFCRDCNCMNCMNNLEHEEHRYRAIKSCMDRNPLAFHPKIGKGGSTRHHSKGCNCKRSGCLKNYCECYEAKIACSSLCRCMGCQNSEENSDRQKLLQLAFAAEVRVQQQEAAESRLNKQILGSESPNSKYKPIQLGEKLPYSFITLEVIEAIGSCLIAEAEENEQLNISDSLQPDIAADQRAILDEFSRCITSVIEMSAKTKD